MGQDVSWAKFSDDAQRNEHILSLSVPARWFWAAAIMENRGYKGGRSPFMSNVRALSLVRQQDVSPKVIKELEATGRWEPVEGGWNIHDFEDFLPSVRELAQDHEPNPVKQAAGQKGAAARWQHINKVGGDSIPGAWQAVSRAQADRKQTDDPVPVPVPVPMSESSKAPLPSLPADLDAIRGPDTELALGMHELFGRMLSERDLIECQLALNQYAYLNAAELLARAHEHVEYCKDHNLPTPRTVAGFADSWRRENDWRSDQGMAKANRVSVTGATGLKALGELLPKPKEANP
jgi:hypothetical protein